MLCQVQNRYNEDQLSCFVQSNVSSRVWSTEDGSTQLLVTSRNLSSVSKCSCSSLQSKLLRCVIERKFTTRRSRPMISEKWTSSRQEIRSRAAVTGDVMAADVSPPPADAALPVRLPVRPQDVDRGHQMDKGYMDMIIVVIFYLWMCISNVREVEEG